MAQDFRNNLQGAVGTTPVNLIVAGDFDAVIGIRICNIITSTVEVDVYITNSGNKYIAKGVVVPPNSAIELIQGGAKIVLENGDTLSAVSNTASSVDIVLICFKALLTNSDEDVIFIYYKFKINTIK